jgi:hypothetical protein
VTALIKPLSPAAEFLIRRLLGSPGGQIPASELLDFGGQAEHVLGGLSKRSGAISLSGPAIWRGRPGRFVLDLSKATVAVTDEAALRTILRMGKRDRLAEQPPKPALTLVKDGAA